MNKVCFVVGVMEYEAPEFCQLSGAKSDALKLFSAFTDADIGDYDKERSTLLISPTLSQMTEAFEKLFLQPDDIDLFTFSFSGHAVIKAGGLYLCLKNSSWDRLSTSAFPLSRLFTVLNEMSPKQSNIIIDACEAGGLVADLRHVINPDILGAKDTPGVSILAAAAAGQSANETQDGGYVTAEILNCLNGNTRVQSHERFLNLVEVGNSISKKFRQNVYDQHPIVWGLNLFGESYLSKNPHYEGDSVAYSYSLANIPPGSAVGRIVQNKSRKLWEIYENLPNELDPRALVDSIQDLCAELDAKHKTAAIGPLVRGISKTVPVRAAQRRDLFAAAEAMTCCIVALLPYVESSSGAKQAAIELSVALTSILHENFSDVIKILDQDNYALLSFHGGPSDLFNVPLRVSKIIGWVSAYLVTVEKVGVNVEEAAKLYIEVIKKILEKYSASFVSTSDSQAAYVFCAFHTMLERNLIPEFEQIFGSYFESYIAYKGKIADVKIDPEKIPEFLIRRYEEKIGRGGKIYAQPDELMAVILYFASISNMEDMVDPYLVEVDHHVFNAFIATNYTEFSKEKIDSGFNVSFHIGLEHGLGVFTVNDFIEHWKKHCRPSLLESRRTISTPTYIGVLLASLLFPDRVPWILEVAHME